MKILFLFIANLDLIGNVYRSSKYLLFKNEPVEVTVISQIGVTFIGFCVSFFNLRSIFTIISMWPYVTFIFIGDFVKIVNILKNNSRITIVRSFFLENLLSKTKCEKCKYIVFFFFTTVDRLWTFGSSYYTELDISESNNCGWIIPYYFPIFVHHF